MLIILQNTLTEPRKRQIASGVYPHRTIHGSHGSKMVLQVSLLSLLDVTIGVQRTYYLWTCHNVTVILISLGNEAYTLYIHCNCTIFLSDFRFYTCTTHTPSFSLSLSFFLSLSLSLSLMQPKLQDDLRTTLLASCHRGPGAHDCVGACTVPGRGEWTCHFARARTVTSLVHGMQIVPTFSGVSTGIWHNINYKEVVCYYVTPSSLTLYWNLFLPSSCI